MKKTLFRLEALEGKHDKRFGDVVITVPFSLTKYTFFLLAITALYTAFLLTNNYERKTTAKGHLVPSVGLVNIHSQEKPGTISQLWANDGDAVKAGDKLITITTHRSSDNTNDLDFELLEELSNTERILNAKLETAKKISQSTIHSLKLEIENSKQEFIELNKNLVTSQEHHALSLKVLKGQLKLRRNKIISANEYQKKQKEHLDVTLDMRKLELLIATTKNSIQLKEQELAKHPLLLEAELAELMQSISEIKQRKINISGQRSYTLFAPVNGVVTGLKTHTGRKVASDERLFAIFPENTKLNVELFLPSEAIGFIELNQPIKIRYNAFPYQRYGLYSGEISKITNVILASNELPNTLANIINQPSYRIIATIDSQSVSAYGKERVLQTGMLLEADVIIESIGFIDWILDPIYQVIGRL